MSSITSGEDGGSNDDFLLMPDPFPDDFLRTDGGIVDLSNMEYWERLAMEQISGVDK